MILAELALRAAGGRLRFLEERALASAWWRQAPERILCLGESTTAPTDRPDHSWPRQLEELLNESAGARRYAVINAGRSSTNSAVLLARLPGLLDEYAPKTVVVMMGVNDSKWYGVLETAARRSGGWRGFAARLRLVKLARYVRYELLRKAVSGAPHRLRAPELARECSSRLTEKACLEAIAADPLDRGSHSVLVDLYRTQGRYGDGEGLMRLAAGRTHDADWTQVPLAEMLILQDRKEQAEPILRGVLSRSSDPAMVNRALMSLEGVYRTQGRSENIGEAYRWVVAFETRGAFGEFGVGDAVSTGPVAGMSPVTVANYRRLREMLSQRGIRLVAMQYPTLPVASLRAVFPDPGGIDFIENREDFRTALREEGYAGVFRDRSFGDWGHCTAVGDRLIAEAVLRVLSPAR